MHRHLHAEDHTSIAALLSTHRARPNILTTTSSGVPAASALRPSLFSRDANFSPLRGSVAALVAAGADVLAAPGTAEAVTSTVAGCEAAAADANAAKGFAAAALGSPNGPVGPPNGGAALL